MLFIQDGTVPALPQSSEFVIILIILALLTNTLYNWTECIGPTTAQTVDVGRSLINILFIINIIDNQLDTTITVY